MYYNSDIGKKQNWAAKHAYVYDIEKDSVCTIWRQFYTYLFS